MMYLLVIGKDQSKAMEVVCASEDCVAVIPEHLSFSEVRQSILYVSYNYIVV